MNSYSSSLPTLLRSRFDNNPPRGNYDVDYFSDTDEFGPLPELIDSVPPPEREYFEIPDTYETMSEDFDEVSVLTRRRRAQNDALQKMPDTYETISQDFDEVLLTRRRQEQTHTLQKMSDKDLLRLSIELLNDVIREHFSGGFMEFKLDDIGDRIVMNNNDFNGEEISIMALYMTEKRKPGFMHNECCFRIALRNSSGKKIRTGLRGFESGTENQTGTTATMDTIIRIVNEIKLQPNFVD